MQGKKEGASEERLREVLRQAQIWKSLLEVPVTVPTRYLGGTTPTTPRHAVNDSPPHLVYFDTVPSSSTNSRFDHICNYIATTTYSCIQAIGLGWHHRDFVIP
ncbi:hypothetical protein ACRALDRAFT_2019962 [Sodiomyces alcalophilus JCM 7366]|uniref:uncharacterized protein n=1 Tax=Sodiomyces alcalophilus JCM 7366 TaxID=591952 RepID=UPI0039B4EE29